MLWRNKPIELVISNLTLVYLTLLLFISILMPQRKFSPEGVYLSLPIQKKRPLLCALLSVQRSGLFYNIPWRPPKCFLFHDQIRYGVDVCPINKGTKGQSLRTIKCTQRLSYKSKCFGLLVYLSCNHYWPST